MKILEYTRNFLFVLLIIYYGQSSLGLQGSSLSKASLLLIIFISSFFFFKVLLLKQPKTMFFKAWTSLLLVNLIGFVFTGNYGSALHISMLKGILMSLLTFYPFYYFAQKGILKSKHLIFFFLVLLPLTIIEFFSNSNQILMERVTDRTDVVNNVAYSFVALIPFIFLLKQKRVLSILAMLVLLYFIIQGAKRGALIAGLIGMLSFFYFLLRTVEKKNRIKGYAMVFFVIVFLGYFGYSFFMENEYLITRLQSIGSEEGSSGRNVIYANLLNTWLSSDSYFNLIFGFGFAASLKLSGSGAFAHNDWLELLSNFGLMGVSIYLFLFYSVTKLIKHSLWSVDKRLLMLTIVLMWFVITLVSMSYTTINGCIQAIMLAFLIGNKSKYLA